MCKFRIRPLLFSREYGKYFFWDSIIKVAAFQTAVMTVINTQPYMMPTKVEYLWMLTKNIACNDVHYRNHTIIGRW